MFPESNVVIQILILGNAIKKKYVYKLSTHKFGLQDGRMKGSTLKLTF